MDLETMKNYNKLEQFEQHFKLLDDLMAYEGNAVNKKAVAKLRKERKQLTELHTKYMENKGIGYGWAKAYSEDKRRGEGGGASESDANARTGLKQLMKDNRSVATKGTQESRDKYKEELQQWEEKNGQLPRLSRRV